MSIPGKYRGLIVVVALALLLGLADKAFSYRLASFATNVLGALIAEVAELTSAEPPVRQTAIAPARPLWNGSRFQFPSSAENPGAHGAFAFGDQPWISSGAPPRLALDATPAQERPGQTSASVPNPGAAQRSTARRSMARNSGGSGTGGASSGGGGGRLTSSAVAAPNGPQAEGADASTTSADLASVPAVGRLEASGLAERWSELESGTPGASDIGAFGDTQYGSTSPIDLTATGFLSDAALDPATAGPGLNVPIGLEVSAVPDMLGVAPADFGLDWPSELRSESALELSQAALTEESSNRAEVVAVLSEPALLAVFGIGLLALASRLRSKFRHVRS